MKMSFKKLIEYNWINNGVLDLFIGTLILDSISFKNQRNNLCFQAIEKIGKGILIMSPRFSVDPSLKANDYPDVEKRIKHFSHDLVSLIHEIDKQYNETFERDLKNKKAILLSKEIYTFYDFLQLFSKREYLDSKYPSHDPSYKQFPMNFGFEAIMHGSLPEELAYYLIRRFLKLALEINPEIVRNVFSYLNRPKQIGERRWRRFRNLIWHGEKI